MIDACHIRVVRSSVLALSAALFLVAATVLFPQAARAQDSNGAVSLSAEAPQILSALNAQRGAAGLGLLIPDLLLSQAAQVQADDILSNYNYSHRGSDGTVARDRVARTGYAANPWVSENWVSSTSPERAMTWWMNDYIHRMNILTPRWKEVGIGAAIRPETGEMVFVTVFSAGRDAAAAPVAVASAVAQPIAVPTGGAEYVVQQGDTLLDIALRYDMDWTGLAAVNSLTDETLLQIGQVLRIPGPDGEYIAAVGGPSVGSQGIGGPTTGDAFPHIITSGDTLFSIASANGITWQELARFNGLSEGAILQIGQTIRIPVSAPAGGQDGPVIGPAEDSAVFHLVEAGDTVIGIALAYSVDWQDLLALNNLSEDSILQPGQAIRLR